MGSKLVAPQMVKQQSGRIIHVASIQGFAASGDCGSYNAAKGPLCQESCRPDRIWLN